MARFTICAALAAVLGAANASPAIAQFGSIFGEPAPGAAPLPPPPAAALPTPPAPGLPPGQRQPRGTPQPGNTAPQPGDEVVTEVPGTKITNPTAVFAGLDKITGRIISFDVAIGETVQFGALQVTPRTCFTRPTTETQNTDAFI